MSDEIAATVGDPISFPYKGRRREGVLLAARGYRGVGSFHFGRPPRRLWVLLSSADEAVVESGRFRKAYVRAQLPKWAGKMLSGQARMYRPSPTPIQAAPPPAEPSPAPAPVELFAPPADTRRQLSLDVGPKQYTLADWLAGKRPNPTASATARGDLHKIRRALRVLRTDNAPEFVSVTRSWGPLLAAMLIEPDAGHTREAAVFLYDLKAAIRGAR